MAVLRVGVIINEQNGTAFAAAQIQELQNIAQYCPDERGEAVLLARVLLNGILGLQVSYMNPCEIMSGSQASMRKAQLIEEEKSKEISVDIFPNPANDILYCNFSSDEKFAKIEFYNVLGELIVSRDIFSGTNEIEISTISSGFYYYKVVQTSKILVQGKVIISH